MSHRESDAAQEFQAAHPQPPVGEVAQPIVVQSHVFDEATTVVRIGPKDPTWKPERPDPRSAPPAQAVEVIEHGAIVERSRELDADGNPRVVRVRL